MEWFSLFFLLKFHVNAMRAASCEPRDVQCSLHNVQNRHYRRVTFQFQMKSTATTATVATTNEIEMD